jgi:SNF2 family DNA or RNA helicase
MFSKYQKSQIFALLCVLRGFGNIELRKRIVSYFANAAGVVHPSPKMLCVYELMKAYPNDKIVIFSSYRVFLEKLMGPWLDQLGISWTLFSGGSRQAQQEALKSFADVRVLLVVKTAGSEGLNLTLGNVCVIMDPHFNSALDEQAAQRVERIGQTKQVIIRKLFMEGSIDMAMKRLQKEKEDNIEAWKKKDEKRSLHSQGLYLEREDTVS